MNSPRTAKKIDPNAYYALREALSVSFWYKRPFESFLRANLQDTPELLAGLNFNDYKRVVVGALVDRLLANEAKYQAVTISLMLTLARMDRFPDLEQQEDRDIKIAQAQAAMVELRKWTDRHQAIVDQHEKRVAELTKTAEAAKQTRAFSESIAELKGQFFTLHANTNHQERGKDFEGFLNHLFRLFDLEPRAEYSIELEQIDGAFSFDTDDYILEARWWEKPIGRSHLDVFKVKVDEKGRNALGLFASVSGFTGDALERYKTGSPFLVMDGADLMAVLEERVRLDDLLRRKKRHVNETGHCYFPASRMLS